MACRAQFHALQLLVPPANTVRIGPQSHVVMWQRSALTGLKRLASGRELQGSTPSIQSTSCNLDRTFSSPWHSREPWRAWICILGTPPAVVVEHRQNANPAADCPTPSAYPWGRTPPSGPYPPRSFRPCTSSCCDRLVREEAHGSGPSWRGCLPF